MHDSLTTPAAAAGTNQTISTFAPELTRTDSQSALRTISRSSSTATRVGSIASSASNPATVNPSVTRCGSPFTTTSIFCAIDTLSRRSLYSILNLIRTQREPQAADADNFA
jgi:hypothetical protein